MWQKLSIGMCLLAGITAQQAARAAVVDSFDDNARDPMWKLVTDAPTELNLVEQNGRLEVIANAPVASTTDALYLSNGPAGFRLSKAADFQIAIDYHFATYSETIPGARMALVLGIGDDEDDRDDPDGMNSAAIGLGWANAGINVPAATTSYRINDTATDGAIVPFAPTSGTFVVSYTAATDSLTFGIEGQTPFSPIVGVVQGEWESESLMVSFGVRGHGYTVTSGQAWLEDFEVRSGVIVPEPASIPVLLLGALAMRRRRQAR